MLEWVSINLHSAATLSGWWACANRTYENKLHNRWLTTRKSNRRAINLQSAPPSILHFHFFYASLAMTPMVVRWFGRSVDRHIGGGLGHTHPWPITRVPLPPFTRPFSPSGSAFVFLPPHFFFVIFVALYFHFN